MKALFKDIRDRDLAAVRARLDAKPELVAAVAKAPPKKDDGQSPLQVAIKIGAFDIANLLLDRGADVDYQDVSAVNEWTVPVVHDAIRAAVMRARWLRKTSYDPANPTWAVANPPELGNEAFALLHRMIDAGADVLCVDSYGNSALMRAVLDARQVLPSYRYDNPDWVDPKPLNDELVVDLHRVFALLGAHGASADEVIRDEGRSMRWYYGREPVAQFLP